MKQPLEVLVSAVAALAPEPPTEPPRAPPHFRCRSYLRRKAEVYGEGNRQHIAGSRQQTQQLSGRAATLVRGACRCVIVREWAEEATLKREA